MDRTSGLLEAAPRPHTGDVRTAPPDYDLPRRPGQRGRAVPLGRKPPCQLQFLVGLQHRVRVDLQRGGQFLDGGQLVARPEAAQPQRVLHLLNELQVGRHPGGGIEPELARRRRASTAGRGGAVTARSADLFTCCH